MKKLCLFTLFAALAVSARADEPAKTPAEPATTPEPIVAPMRGTLGTVGLPSLPGKILFKDLSKSWTKFYIDAPDISQRNYNNWDASRMQMMQEQLRNDLGIGIHFTKGESVVLGKESYLIAYRSELTMDPQELQQEIQNRMNQMWGNHGGPPNINPSGKFSPGAPLRLVLLNLRNAGDLKDVSSFDPKTDLLNAADLRQLSNTNLNRIGDFLRQLSDGYWSTQPLPLRDMATLRNTLQNNFHAGTMILRDPATNGEYAVNTALGGKKLEVIGNAEAIPAVFEKAPSTDNTRGVLFLDGHVARVPEWKWKSIKAISIKPQTARGWRIISNRRLVQLGSYYIQMAYQRQYPKPPKTQQQLLSRLQRYGWGANIMQHPRTGKNYLFNIGAYGISAQQVTNAAQVVTVYEAGPDTDGTIGAAFLDGRSRRVPAARWKATLAVKPDFREGDN